MNFKPGDKAIYIGSGDIPSGTEVRVIAAGPFGKHEIRTPKKGLFNMEPCDYLCESISSGNGFFTTEPYLRKPDDYDITAQDWYQRILRGEKLEETV